MAWIGLSAETAESQLWSTNGTWCRSLLLRSGGSGSGPGAPGRAGSPTVAAARPEAVTHPGPAPAPDIPAPMEPRTPATDESGDDLPAMCRASEIDVRAAFEEGACRAPEPDPLPPAVVATLEPAQFRARRGQPVRGFVRLENRSARLVDLFLTEACEPRRRARPSSSGSNRPPPAATGRRRRRDVPERKRLLAPPPPVPDPGRRRRPPRVRGLHPRAVDRREVPAHPAVAGRTQPLPAGRVPDLHGHPG